MDYKKYITYDKNGKAKWTPPLKKKTGKEKMTPIQRKRQLYEKAKKYERRKLIREGLLDVQYGDGYVPSPTRGRPRKKPLTLEEKKIKKIEEQVITNTIKVLDKDLPAYKYIVINKNDPDLKPFVIWLPVPPNRRYIENYNKPLLEQRFKYTVIPQRLLDLEEKLKYKLDEREAANSNKKSTKQKLQVEMWKYLQSNAKDYKDEIEFIKREQYKLMFGAWFYINGRPTYISKWHYRYLNYWSLGGGIKPEFRFRDWEYFHLHEYAYKTTHDSEENDMFTKTLLGVVYPKHRRDGATHKSLCILYSIMMERGSKKQGGIQSFDEVNAFEHYKSKLLISFDDMPFYLKPMWTGTDMPLNGLRFSKQTGISGIKPFNSQITYAKSAKRTAYDGFQLDCILTDESGKTISEDVLERHEVMANTVTLGSRANVFGFMMYPTTVADMEEGGGKQFFKLCNQSNFYERDASGQTKSGLIVYFKSAVYGLEGFIDVFGQDIVDDPTKEDLWRIENVRKDKNGKYIGARRFLIDKLNSLKDDITSYNNQVRLFPIRYSNCFNSIEGDIGFDTNILKERRDKILIKEANGQYDVRKGYYVWNINGTRYTSKDFITLGYQRINGITDNAIVEWIDDINGRFTLSYMPKNNNDRYKDKNVWFPTNKDSFTHSADPFKYLTDSEANNIYRDKKGKLSDGGIAVFWERDFELDPLDKDVTTWTTHRYVSDYLHRPSLDEFCEDAIMQMVFFGGMMFPETNVDTLWKYIVDRGFEGYLLYQTDPSGKSKFKSYPGFNSGTDSKQKLFSLMRSYVSTHGMREYHLNIIKQIIDIKGLSDMTNKDLFTAAAGCLLGSTSRMRMLISKREVEISEEYLEDFW